MRKVIISYFLIMLILCQIMVMPVSAVVPGEDSAAGDVVLSYEEIVGKAVQAFPEYAKQIRKQAFSREEFIRICSDENPTLVVNETRAISETEIVAYQEYSNGISFVEVASVDLFVMGGIDDIQSETIDAATGYVLSIHMISCSQQVLRVTGIRCALQPGYYSQIFDYGTISGDASAPIINRYQDQWIAATPAYIECACGFTYLSDVEGGIPLVYNFTGFLLVEVGPFELSVTARSHF